MGAFELEIGASQGGQRNVLGRQASQSNPAV